MRTFLLNLSVGLIIAAAIVSIAGGHWNTFGHHTALTDLALAAFFASFHPGVSKFDASRNK